MKYSINRLIKLEQNTLKEADRIMPNYQTSMDILREDAREEELLVRLINKGYLKNSDN